MNIEQKMLIPKTKSLFQKILRHEQPFKQVIPPCFLEVKERKNIHSIYGMIIAISFLSNDLVKVCSFNPQLLKKIGGVILILFVISLSNVLVKVFLLRLIPFVLLSLRSSGGEALILL